MNTNSERMSLIFAFILMSFSGFCQDNESANSLSAFDFSSVEAFKTKKGNGTIVNDYDGIFTPAQEAELSKLIYDYHIKTTNQIVVVTVDHIAPYTDIQKFATDLSNYWGVGDAVKKNGLTILVCSSCRQISIATGLGTEQILTNEICQDVISNVIIPEFKNQKFFNGVKNGIEALIDKWDQ